MAAPLCNQRGRFYWDRAISHQTAYILVLLYFTVLDTLGTVPGPVIRSSWT